MDLDWRQVRDRLQQLADPALALVVLGLSLQPLLAKADCDCDPTAPWAYLLVVVECAPIAVRRRWPFQALFVTGMASAVYGISPLPDPPVYYAALVLIYTVASLGTPRQAHVSAVVAVVSVTVALILDFAVWDYQDVTVMVATFITAYVLGDAARQRRERARALEARADQLERAREAEARAAVVAERNRIARELHDSVAHHVSVIVVQAEAGPVVVEQHPGQAVAAFESISRTGRQALVEMRQLLGVLKADGEASREPQPGLDELDALVERGRAGRLDVTLVREGNPRALTTAVDLSAYRLVQEALTNAVRHAPGSRVEITVDFADDLLVTIVDDGGLLSDGDPATDESTSDDASGAGHGLLAMRERVALVGGSLEVGPAGRGWRVVGHFPLDEHSS